MKKKLLSFILAAALVLSACNSDDNVSATETTTLAEATTQTTETETTTSAEATTQTTETETATSAETITQTTETTTSAETITQTTETTTSAETTTQTTEIVTETTDTETTTSTITSTEETAMTETTEQTAEKKYIALTFDDGPNITTTNQVLDVLEKYGVKASFFLVGSNINENTESVVKRAFDMGCDIENHSKTHSDMTQLTEEEIKAEIDYTNEYIEKITGVQPMFFRPPYIAVSNKLYNTVDMTFICGFGCNDWDDRVPTDRRVTVISREAADGGIILLHDSQGNDKTVEAIDILIPKLQAEGYEFVTVTELFEIKGVEISGDSTALHTFVK